MLCYKLIASQYDSKAEVLARQVGGNLVVMVTFVWSNGQTLITAITKSPEVSKSGLSAASSPVDKGDQRLR